MLEFERVWQARILPAAGDQALRECLQRLQLRLLIRDQRPFAKQHHRAIVDRMMKRGTREHQPVDDRHRHTRINATRKSFQHPARLRTVNVERVVNTRISGWDHDRLSAGRKTDDQAHGFRRVGLRMREAG